MIFCTDQLFSSTVSCWLRRQTSIHQNQAVFQWSLLFSHIRGINCTACPFLVNDLNVANGETYMAAASWGQPSITTRYHPQLGLPPLATPGMLLGQDLLKCRWGSCQERKKGFGTLGSFLQIHGVAMPCLAASSSNLLNSRGCTLS